MYNILSKVWVNIISQNVNGFNNYIKRKKILQQLKNEKGDIVFLRNTFDTRGT